MPDWIELPADYGIERAKVRILDVQIVKVKLLPKAGVSNLNLIDSC
jgi:hypothetical protein